MRVCSGLLFTVHVVHRGQSGSAHEAALPGRRSLPRGSSCRGGSTGCQAIARARRRVTTWSQSARWFDHGRPCCFQAALASRRAYFSMAGGSCLLCPASQTRGEYQSVQGYSLYHAVFTFAVTVLCAGLDAFATFNGCELDLEEVIFNLDQRDQMSGNTEPHPTCIFGRWT